MEDVLAVLQDALGIPELAVKSLSRHDDLVRVKAEVLLRRSQCPKPKCGEITDKICQYIPREVRHLPMWGRRPVIEFDEYQFACPSCGQKWIGPLGFLSDKYYSHTTAYERYLFPRVSGDTAKRLAKLEGLPEKTVYEIVSRWGARAYPQDRPLPPVRVLGIDEISARKGHGHYRAVLYDLERGAVLEVLENREKATIVAFLQKQPEAWRRGIRRAAMDLWEGFHQAVGEVLPWVVISADPFHVVKQLHERINQARREIQGSLPKSKAKKLKGIRWALLKAPENLKPKEARALQRALPAVPPLATMYRMKEEFRRILKGKRTGVARRLRRWMERAQQTGLAGLQAFVRTLTNWWSEVLHAIQTGDSNGAGEGCNHKIKALRRRAYGIPNFNRFRERVLHEFAA